MRFVYESNVPGRLSDYEVERRTDLWKLAGITHVMLQVDDGRGASWESSYLPVNPNSHASALAEYVSYMYANNLSVILVFNLAGIYMPDSPVRPDLLVSGVTPPHYYYNMWSPEVIQWRTRIIEECLSLVRCDMVGLDFVRTGREGIAETASSADAVQRMLSEIRKVVPYPIAHLSNAGWIGKRPLLQGIDAWRWYREGLVDYSCLFWYINNWPDLKWVNTERILALAGSYDTTTGQSKTGMSVHLEHENLMRKYPSLGGYGLYTANKITFQQVELMKTWV